MKIALITTAALVLASGAAIAQPIQINQAVVAANATNRATGGFPYMITQPGSYQLSGNLVVPAGVNGIGIAANNVTLDLNGFNITLLGPNIAIFTDNPQSTITIRNGTLTGPNGEGAIGLFFIFSTSVNVESLLVSGFPAAITVGSNSIVRHNVATALIQVACPSIISENVTTGFLSEVGTGKCVRWNNRSQADTAEVKQ
jgi:hypothetical protein